MHASLAESGAVEGSVRSGLYFLEFSPNLGSFQLSCLAVGLGGELQPRSWVRVPVRSQWVLVRPTVKEPHQIAKMVLGDCIDQKCFGVCGERVGCYMVSVQRGV